MLEFDVFDVFHGVHRAFQLPENAVQKRDKPRASGLTSDAREIAYLMAGTTPSNPHAFNPDRMDGAMTAEQGRMMEDLLVAAIANMDLPNGMKYEVVDRQIELPASYFVTGHPDGRINNTLFESKHFGRFAYKEIARDGIWGEKGRDVLAQAAMYCDALDYEGALIVITSQDASSMRMELRTKAFISRGIHPKMMLHYVPREQLQPLIPPLKERAEFFINWMAGDGNPGNVAWESTPNRDKFPWSYSEFVDRAIIDGEGLKQAPPAFVFS